MTSLKYSIDCIPGFSPAVWVHCYRNLSPPPNANFVLPPDAKIASCPFLLYIAVTTEACCSDLEGHRWFDRCIGGMIMQFPSCQIISLTTLIRLLPALAKYFLHSSAPALWEALHVTTCRSRCNALCTLLAKRQSSSCKGLWQKYAFRLAWLIKRKAA